MENTPLSEITVIIIRDMKIVRLMSCKITLNVLQKFTNVSKLDEKERKEIREKELYMKRYIYKQPDLLEI